MSKEDNIDRSNKKNSNAEDKKRLQKGKENPSEEKIKMKRVSKKYVEEHQEAFQSILSSIMDKRVTKKALISYILLLGRLSAGGLLEITTKRVKKKLISKIDLITKDEIIKWFEKGFSKPIAKEYFETNRGIKTLREDILSQTLPEGKHFRVGNDYYENILKPVGNLNVPDYAPRKESILKYDYGWNYPRQIKKYDGWFNEPNYLDYKIEKSNHKNLSQPLQHKRVEGKFPFTEKMFDHIFGDEVKVGYDYVQLLYEQPKQLLPILCLVSQENETGKTTFINWLNEVFKGNATIINSSDITANFNHHYAYKHVICVDESDLQKESTTSKIKQLATQIKTHIKRKFVDESEVPFYGKFILLSNDETTFINIKLGDNRFWIRKVGSLKDNKKQADFFQNIIKEIPHFLYHIHNRELHHREKQSRLWFASDVLDNEFLKRAKEDNRYEATQTLIPILMQWFQDHTEINEIIVTPKMLREENDEIYQIGSKYLGKCLRVDLGLSPSEKQEDRINPFNNPPFEESTYSSNKKYKGKFYTITREQIENL